MNDKPISFLLVDLKRLCDIVRDENSEALSHSGRVKALAVILETDIKGDISDNMANLIHKRMFLLPISNKIHLQKAPQLCI